MKVNWVVLGVVGWFGCGESLATATAPDGFLEPDTGEVIVDADVLADDDDTVVSSTAQGLTVALVGGRDDVWSRTARKRLSYCVDEAGFGRWAGTVAAAMKDATADWERSANVQFVAVTAENGRCTRSNDRVVFNVRPVSGRPYLARSFFPSSPRSKRELLIDATSLPPPRPLSLTGVLRHELGHALGLRHEHTRKQSNRCYEDSNWRAVTSYDVRSVMHYPQCAGVMGRDLELTARDRQGVGLLYP